MNNSLYNNKLDDCPLTYSLTLISGKWRLPIIWSIYKNEVIRYNDLKRKIQGITNMMLSQSLKELEACAIITRKQFEEIPPRVEYSLTEHGHSLILALKALANWGEDLKIALGGENERNTINNCDGNEWSR